MINFLYPSFLLGLLAIAIPIIIHFFAFRKTKRVFFSNNQFLQIVKQSNQTRSKLKKILILTSRILFITFLVLAFAQPYIKKNLPASAERRVHIYIDNSLSMTNETKENISALNVATQIATNLINKYPQNTKFNLLTNNFAGYSNIYQNKNDALELITEIKTSSVPRSFEQVINRFKKLDVLNNQTTPIELYYISDFQKSTSKLTPEKITIDSSSQTHLIPIDLPQQDNVFIDSVFLENPFFIDNKNIIHVHVRNESKNDIEDLILKLFVNQTQIATSSINIKSFSTTATSFVLNIDLKEFNQCRISFEEFPVTFDNDFIFTLEKNKKIRILEIKDKLEKTVFEKVYANQGLFNFQSYSKKNINYTLIDDTDLVILNNIAEIPSSLQEKLKKYTNNNGHVIIIPSPTLDIKTYALLFSIPSIEQSITLTQKELQNPDLNNPFFDNIFEKKEHNYNMPKAQNVITWAKSPKDILRFKDGNPFLSQLSNQIFLLANPLNNNFTNFHKHAIFVPIMYKIAIKSKSLDEKLYFNTSENLITVDVDSVQPNTIFSLLKEDEELIPYQRLILNKLSFEIPKYTLTPGFYRLTVNESTKKILAFNQSKEESLLEQYNVTELKETFKTSRNIKIYEFNDLATAHDVLNTQQARIPLWKIAILLSLLFLLIEILLIRFL